MKDLVEKEPTAAKREMWECLDLSNSWWSLRLWSLAANKVKDKLGGWLIKNWKGRQVKLWSSPILWPNPFWPPPLSAATASVLRQASKCNRWPRFFNVWPKKLTETRNTTSKSDKGSGNFHINKTSGPKVNLQVKKLKITRCTKNN